MRRNYTVKRNNTGIHRFWAIVFGVALIAITATVSFFQYKYHMINTTSIAEYAAHARTWAAEHNVHLHQNIQKVKQFASNQDDPEPPIQFEFYKTLSNTQMVSSNPIIASAQPAPLPTPATKKVMNDTISKSSKPILTTPSIVSASDLEQQLSEQISEDNYVIQAGLFHDPAGAEQFQHSLAAIGFFAKVVKLTNADKEIYRVQLGPYNNKSQAKLAQQKLQRKGMTGIIRKT